MLLHRTYPRTSHIECQTSQHRPCIAPMFLVLPRMFPARFLSISLGVLIDLIDILTPMSRMTEDSQFFSWEEMMSTLPLYTCISTFSMIYNICATFSSIIRLGQYCRTCFEPLAIYTMSFRPFPTISDVLRCFYGISDVCLLISDLSLHRWTIYAFPIL